MKIKINEALERPSLTTNQPGLIETIAEIS